MAKPAKLRETLKLPALARRLQRYLASEEVSRRRGRDRAMKFFRELTEEEKEGFRKWARENYKVYSPIKGIWHPIVQEECVAR